MLAVLAKTLLGACMSLTECRFSQARVVYPDLVGCVTAGQHRNEVSNAASEHDHGWRHLCILIGGVPIL